MKKVIRRILAVLPAVVMQGLWIWLLFSWLAPYATVLSWVLTVFAVVLEMYILTSRVSLSSLVDRSTGVRKTHHHHHFFRHPYFPCRERPA